MADIFKAIADSTRREILLMLIEDASNIGEIAENFKMTRPAVAKHIKILQKANLVNIETDSVDTRQRNCYVQLEALKEVEDYLSKLERYWQTRLKGLGEYLSKNNTQ